MLNKLVNKFINYETISYIIFGGLTTLLSIVVFWLCEQAYMSVALSNTISTIAAVIFAYFVNKIYVFRATNWRLLHIVRELSLFISGRFATYIMETLLLVVLVNLLGLDAFLCKLFTTALVIIVNYLLSKWMFTRGKFNARINR